MVAALPGRNGIVPGYGLLVKSGEDGNVTDTIIGVDLAKRVFQIHGATVAGHVKFRKKLSRDLFRSFMAGQPACMVVFEACGSASYWAREMRALGHEVKLIAPQYVRPFVKRQKNDAADAEAIVTAARQPNMRFVPPKTEGQQAKAVLFRCRERLVHQRTELVNALRGVLYEFGHVFPQGIAHLGRIEELVRNPACDLPALIIEECQDILLQISTKTEQIEAKTKRLKAIAAETDMACRLQTMQGAVAPDMSQFKCGRDFAAWLGLVPRQHSSGGKERLGRVSKAGQSDIRHLLIIGAMTRIVGRARHKIPANSWIGRMLVRKPKMLVGIALANKMARQIWAMLVKKEDYRNPAAV
jgi:transposase